MSRRIRNLTSWLLLLETGLALTAAVLLKRLLPFRITSRLLGRQVERPRAAALPEALHTNLVWAFHFFQRLPSRLRPVCLTEVLALCLLLRHRGLCGTAALGANKDDSNLRLHAWMLCGPQLLPRQQNLEGFRIIALFESPPSP